MIETLQIENVPIISIDPHAAPKLLVEWTPRWENFVTSIGPALARSGPKLAGEAAVGGVPYRGLSAALLAQLLVLCGLLFLPREISRLRPYAAPRLRPYEVIYYSGDELPRTEDLSGSHSGTSGRAGGHEAHHNTQSIRIARGGSLSDKIVDAPNLKLPSSANAVANLLALKSKPVLPGVAPAPSADGLHSSLSAPALSANIVAPAPEIAAEHSRRGISLVNPVVAPAPNISPERSRFAPSLNAAVVPPAPTAPSDHRLIAPLLAPSIIAPAPNISARRSLSVPSLHANIVAPAPTQLSRDQARSTPALDARVIPPAPSATGREVPSTRVQMTNVAVVPPPVSAPERESIRTAKLNLPAPSVVAPPPSADSAHDLRRLESGVASNSPHVVPPPPQANASFVSGIIGKLFGTQDVVPPPPSLASSSRTSSGALVANVVPPPPSAPSLSSQNSASSRRTPSSALGANVIAPPPSASAAENAGLSRSSPRALSNSIIAPPPSMNTASQSGSENSTTARGTSLNSIIVPPPPSGSASGVNRNGAVTLANNVVPPPPSVGSASGTGAGRKAVGLVGDTGSALPPPKPASNTDNSGVVASAKPGSNVALPISSKGSLALSPSGGEKPGIGGSGSGASIGHGEGSGSGLAVSSSPAKPGAGRTGDGRGSDPAARAGISPNPGPGGAGSVPTGSPAVPGVDVRGGSTVVTLPSFGSDGGAGAPPLPGRTNLKSDPGPAITIVATSRSGGAFDFYGKLPGDNYTVYVDTSIGTVVMQFADANPGHAGALTGPEAIRSNLPAGLPHARMVVKCSLSASGNITNLQVLEPGPASMTAKVIAALSGWKFRPAMRGAQPVEVNAILGFNIDTHDRY